VRRQGLEPRTHLADRAYVLQTGAMVTQGPAAELAASADVRRAYLGM
jgi:branched-chain amino acid transport system ATP-binding protein